MPNLNLFFDENVAPLGERLASHPDAGSILWVGHPDLPGLPLGTKDVDLLQAVGRLGLLFITHDQRMHTRPWEKRQIYDAAVRLVQITATGYHDDWYKLIVRYWQRLSEIDADASGPCFFRLNRTGIHVSRLPRYPN